MFKGVALGFLFLGAGKVVEKGLKSLKFTDQVLDVANATNKQKGNFGEIKAAANLSKNKKLKSAGYDLTRIGDKAPTGFNNTIKKGIDGLYENATPPPQFVIDEAKYGTSKLSKTVDGNKQMSDGWIEANDYKRLTDQVDEDKAREIIRAMENGEVEKILSNIDESGNVVTKSLDELGKIIGDWP